VLDSAASVSSALLFEDKFISSSGLKKMFFILLFAMFGVSFFFDCLSRVLSGSGVDRVVFFVDSNGVLIRLVMLGRADPCSKEVTSLPLSSFSLSLELMTKHFVFLTEVAFLFRWMDILVRGTECPIPETVDVDSDVTPPSSINAKTLFW
jgi:hypothetical protein